jgi:hypothetical protein
MIMLNLINWNPSIQKKQTKEFELLLEIKY